MDAMSSGNKSDAEPMSTYILEDIHDICQYHLSINRREAHYSILDNPKKGKWNGKERYYQCKK